ncbi:MAG: acetyl-CoA carboxylase biotin carboxyl carrier protein [Bacteroidota bacterium]|jgi:acetyl-CoA carboxylase biotin carboxyl carrier protein|nr:acetyl-CoA carboxylase biotin carboxyl carrier protein [Bacteroidota bacterium]
MDLQFVRKCIKIVNDAQIAELEIEEDGMRLRITRSFGPEPSVLTTAAVPAAPVVAAPAPLPPTPAAAAGEETSASRYHEVRSPIVGTFYRASSPDAAPFAAVGDTVGNGQVLCIIEAMKIMNEIESDMAGRIVKILVENAQPVEYNQPLFLIDPS